MVASFSIIIEIIGRNRVDINMKRIKKIMLLIVFCLSNVLFLNNVFALSKEYLVFENGSTIFYNDKIEPGHYCMYVNPLECEKYVVSDDNGVNDPDLVITKENDSNKKITVLKEDIQKDMDVGYILKASQPVEINYYGLYDTTFDEKYVDKIIYFDNKSDLNEIIKKADKYDNIYFPYCPGESLEVPNGVTLTTRSIYSGKNIINNGTIRVGKIVADRVSGTGTLEVSYKTHLGDGGFSEPLRNASRIQIESISNVKVNILDYDIEDNIPFTFIGMKKDYSEAEAQAKINMFSKVLGKLSNEYILKLSSASSDKENYYYGNLIKKSEIQELIFDNKNSLTFKCEMDCELLSEVLINSEKLPEEYYDLDKENNLFILKKEYLQKLNVGKYELTLKYSNNKDAILRFNIMQEDKAISNEKNPNTGDSINLYFSLFIISLSLILVQITKLKK